MISNWFGALREGLLVKTVALSILAFFLVAFLEYQDVFLSQETAVQGKVLTFHVEEEQESRNTPTIALLFLSRGPLHNEPVWRAFLERAKEVKFRDSLPLRPHVSFVESSEIYLKANSPPPHRSLTQAEIAIDLENCSKEPDLIHKEILRLKSTAEDAKTLISSQKLFTVYTHPSQGYYFPNISIFHGTEVKNRIDTMQAWATFRLVQAELLLLQSSLEDPRNRKFVLLSESCVPLHRPEVIFLQLLSESKSRINSCYPFGDRVDLSRWDDGMKSAFLDRSKWRKSSQWFALHRTHAELIIKEKHVKQKFAKYCKAFGKNRCVSDEHYIATTLAVYGLDNETDCIGRVTSTIWYRGHSHPLTYGERVVSPMLIRKLRHIGSCDTGKAQTTAASFLKQTTNTTHCFIFNPQMMNYSRPIDVDDWVVRSGYKKMGYDCRLFARKFPLSVINKTLRSLLACAGGGLGAWC